MIVKKYRKKLFGKKSGQIVKTTACAKCGFHCHTEHPKLQGFGNFKRKIMIISDPPTEQDMKANQYMSNKSQRDYLRKSLADFNISLEDDCYVVPPIQCPVHMTIDVEQEIANFEALQCSDDSEGCDTEGGSTERSLTERSFSASSDTKDSGSGAYKKHGKRKATKEETKRENLLKKALDYCYPALERIILDKKPEVIMTFGKYSTRAIVSKNYKSNPGEYSLYTEYAIPLHKYNCHLAVNFGIPFMYQLHKATKGDKSSGRDHNRLKTYSNFFENNLLLAESCLGKPLRKYKDMNECVHILNEAESVSYLMGLIDSVPEFVYFDIEANSLRGINHDAKTLTVAYATDEDNSYSFEWTPKVAELSKIMLEDSRIGVGAHNMFYEKSFLHFSSNIGIANLTHDSMIASFMLDMRRGTKGLKFQSWVRFGAEDYDSYSKQFFKSEDKKTKGDNALNKLEEAELAKVLQYNGLDTLLGYRLSMLQKEKTKNDDKFQNMYELLHDGTLALCEMSINGLCLDVDLCTQYTKQITEEVNQMEKEILETDLGKKWTEMYGKDTSIRSNDQLYNILYNKLKLRPMGIPSGVAYTCEIDMLNKLDHWLPKKILEYRKMNKLSSTYLSQFMREVSEDGKLHCTYGLTNTLSSRSSALAPSLMNLPAHDATQAKYIRGVLKPRKGNMLCEVDYSSIEAKTSACLHFDPLYTKEIQEGLDTHNRNAQEAFLLDDKIWELMQTKDNANETSYRKNIRGNSKEISFSILYGSIYLVISSTIYAKIVSEKWELWNGYTLYDHIGTQLFGSEIEKSVRKKLSLPDDATIEQVDKLESTEKKIYEAMGVKLIDGYDNLCTDDQLRILFLYHMEAFCNKFWGEWYPTFDQWRKDYYAQYLEKGYIQTVNGLKIQVPMTRTQNLNLENQGISSNMQVWAISQITKEIKKREWKTRLVAQVHDSILADIYPPEAKEFLQLVEEVMTKWVHDRFKWLIVDVGVEADLSPIDGSWLDKSAFSMDTWAWESDKMNEGNKETLKWFK